MVSVVSSSYQIFQNGSIRCHSHSGADHDRHLIFIPILIPSPERALDAQSRLKTALLRHQIGVKGLAQFPRPDTLRLDVDTQVAIVRHGCEGERMRFLGAKSRAKQPDPLAGAIHEIRRPDKLQVNHVCNIEEKSRYFDPPLVEYVCQI